jgi:hypothetical protein
VTGASPSLVETLENLLLEAIARLDGATDCLTCAEAAVALRSQRAADAIVVRIAKIAREDFRFRSNSEYLVIRDLATAVRVLKDGFAA